MKLRIHGNSVRLRLGRSEIDRLLESGGVQEHAAFGPGPDQRLWYVIELSTDEAAPRVALDGLTVRVSLPVRDARRWAATEQVGIDVQQDVGGGVTGESLHLIIEKDFQCLHGAGRSAADEADSFPNPAATGA